MKKRFLDFSDVRPESVAAGVRKGLNSLSYLYRPAGRVVKLKWLLADDDVADKDALTADVERIANTIRSSAHQTLGLPRTPAVFSHPADRHVTATRAGNRPCVNKKNDDAYAFGHAIGK